MVRSLVAIQLQSVATGCNQWRISDGVSMGRQLEYDKGKMVARNISGIHRTHG